MSTIDSIITDLARFEVQVKTLKSETAAQLKMIMAEMFQSFFAAFPDVKTIHWTQYTPYFNDGDECTFRLDSVEFSYQEYGGIEDGEFDEGDSFGVSKYSNRHELPTELYQSCIAIEDVLKSMSEDLKDMLDNHVKVFVTARGIDVEEYEHE
jgi:hypothetical protein